MGCICKKAENPDSNVEFNQPEMVKQDEPICGVADTKDNVNVCINKFIFSKE